MYKKLKRVYRLTRLLWRFLVVEEIPSRPPVSFWNRIKLLRRGFLTKWFELYNFKDYKLEDYFSDWDKAKMSLMYDDRNKRAGYPYGLNNKLFSTAILGHSIQVPPVYGVIEKGQVLPLAWEEEITLGELWSDTCKATGGQLVLKPTAGRCGQGVYFISMVENQLLLNQSPTTENDLNTLVNGLDEYMIVKYIQQGKYSSNLYPHTPNTVRLITIVDPQTSKPFVAMAVQRIGRETSKPVDNFKNGGLCTEIDLETGILGRAATCPAPGYHLEWHESHPDTGGQIKGVVVPQWDQIKQKILKTASSMIYFKFLSWDMLIQDDGVCIIEADTISGLDVLQVNRPLLRDSRIREFLEFHGVISKNGRHSQPV